MIRYKLLQFSFILFTGVASVWAQPNTRGSGPPNVVSSTPQDTSLFSSNRYVNRALIIANNDYPKMNGSKRKLPGVEQDVPALKAFFEKQKFQVKVLNNLTGSELNDEIEDFLRENDVENARLLIWFAGHGHTLEEVGRKMGYLVGVDGDIPDQKNTEAVRAFKKAAVELSAIQNKTLTNRNALHVLFVFDSCFSGLAARGTENSEPSYIQAKLSGRARQYITAGNDKQLVNDQSPLRTFFIKAIQEGAADTNLRDGYVTFSELSGYLETKVSQLTHDPSSGLYPQDPQWGDFLDQNLNNGDFVFKVENYVPLPLVPVLTERTCESPVINMLSLPNVIKVKKEVTMRADFGGTNPQFEWHFGDEAPKIGSNFIRHTYTKPGQYTLRIVAKNECGEDQYSSPIQVQNVCTGLYCGVGKWMIRTLVGSGAAFAACRGAGRCGANSGVARPPVPPGN
ncbi:MAG TPA: caspase family protein [Rhodothermales bacterium]|nr:caspase family protein [Rhodothermales bacterium]